MFLNIELQQLLNRNNPLNNIFKRMPSLNINLHTSVKRRNETKNNFFKK